MHCRISVIVPAHNAAPYLERCYTDLCAQAVTDWEMLIVENGSTDDTSARAEQLARQDGRVRVLHSDKGVSNARNRGIDAARGAYTTFVDADDRLLPDAFSIWLNIAEAHPSCDVVIGGTEDVTDGEADTVFRGARVDEARARFLRRPTRYLTVWGNLYRTAFLQESAVRFDPALTHAEDSDYLIRLLKGCRELALADRPVYHYCINPRSAVHGQVGKLTDKYRLSLETTERHLADESVAVREAFLFYVLDNLLVLLVHDTFAHGRAARAARQAAADVLETPIFRRALDAASLEQVALPKRLALLAAKRRRLWLLQCIVRLRQWQNRHLNV